MSSTIRVPLIVFLVLASFTAGVFAWIHISGRPPVIFPITTDGVGHRSGDFWIVGDGLYVVTLRFSDTADQAAFDCGVDMDDPSACVLKPVPFSWTLYRGDTLIAKDDPGPRHAIDGRLRKYDLLERELGAVKLNSGGGYRLEVRSLAGAAQLKIRNPSVQMRLHVWDVKNSLGWLIVFGISAIGAAVSAVVLVIVLIAEALRRRRV